MLAPLCVVTEFFFTYDSKAVEIEVIMRVDKPGNGYGISKMNMKWIVRFDCVPGSNGRDLLFADGNIYRPAFINNYQVIQQHVVSLSEVRK